jgi:hypothetical protein
MDKFKEDLFIAFCLLLLGLDGFAIICLNLPILLDIMLLIMYSLLWTMVSLYIWFKVEDD